MKKNPNKESKKVRAGDKVVVIAGNCRGQFGTVLVVQDDRVVIQGLNMAKKAVKKSQQHPKGGIVEVERPMHISNVAPCDNDGNKLKVHVKIEKDGEKVLAYKKGKDLEVWRSMKRPTK